MSAVNTTESPAGIIMVSLSAGTLAGFQVEVVDQSPSPVAVITFAFRLKAIERVNRIVSTDFIG
jgi:hypothetical protein